IAERVGEKSLAVDGETGAIFENCVDVVQIELHFHRELAARGAHRVAAAPRECGDPGKLTGPRCVDGPTVAEHYPTPFAVSNIGGCGALAAMETDHGRSHALVFEPQRAARIAFGAERLEAGKKPFEALLPALEQVR